MNRNMSNLIQYNIIKLYNHVMISKNLKIMKLFGRQIFDLERGRRRFRPMLIKIFNIMSWLKLFCATPEILKSIYGHMTYTLPETGSSCIWSNKYNSHKHVYYLENSWVPKRVQKRVINFTSCFITFEEFFPLNLKTFSYFFIGTWI